MNKDTTDYKQIAFKLQSDIEQMKWEEANNNLPFLKELKERVQKSQSDSTELEMALKMIDDWIDELTTMLEEKPLIKKSKQE